MNIDEKILEAYKILKSVKAVHRETGYSWNRIVKSLSSSGVVINETHALILKYHEEGMSPLEISKQIGVNVKTVQSYLPRVRPVYGENRSKNAVKITEWRSKKKGEMKNE